MKSDNEDPEIAARIEAARALKGSKVRARESGGITEEEIEMALTERGKVAAGIAVAEQPAPNRERQTVSAVHGGSGQSKVVRYGWEVVDEPGKYRETDKNGVLIDPAYQRETVLSKCRRMAAEWSWMACGTILVVDRDGRLYCFDGGHRVMAARMRDDIVTLPALVFRSAGVSSEALAFLRHNTDSKPLTAVDRFRARVTAGDTVAVLVDTAVRASGFEIFRGEGVKQVQCASALYDMAETSHELFTDLWPVIVEASEYQHIKNDAVRGLHYLEKRLRAKGFSLTVPPWRERVIEAGIAALQTSATKEVAHVGKGGPRVYAEGILRLLNHGRRNRLTFTGPVTDA